MMKKVLSTIIAIVMLFSIAALMPVVTAQEGDTEYATFEGVLADDYYVLYPFTKKSLKIGISKYGELIDGETNVGLEYGGEVDPFAAPAGSEIGSIPKDLWLQGWMIWIEYDHVTWGHRVVWAAAMFADGTAWGGPWLRVDFGTDDFDPDGSEGDIGGYVHFEDFTDLGRPYDPANPLVYVDELSAGGRKTNGTAVTEPLKVIYHGPRKVVVETSTTIYDYKPGMSNPFAYPLVKVRFIFIFDKVKKQVIILKDIKSLLPNKVGTQMKIQFSNRGEVDLGTEEAGYSSYFHFYTIGTSSGNPIFNDTEEKAVTTVYNSLWTEAKTEDPGTTEFPGYSAAGPFPQYTIAQSYGLTSDSDEATFDVFQAINPLSGHVFWAAFWPSLSDWCADGWAYPGANVWWRAMYATDPHYTDASPNRAGGEPAIPFYVAEWDFLLGWAESTVLPTHFRAVTVYGITDLVEADDADIGDVHSNVLEDEALNFQLKQVFWPWDLRKAVGVNEGLNYAVKPARLVNFFYDVLPGEELKLYYPISGGDVPTDAFVYVPDDAWDDYSTFAERLLGDGKLLVRGVDYIVNITDPGTYVNITMLTGPYSRVKVLFSVYSLSSGDVGPTYSDRGAYEWIVVGRDSDPVDSAGAAMVAEYFLSKGIEVMYSALDMQDVPYHPKVPFIFAKIGGVEDVRGSRDAYRDGVYGPNTGKAALKDDWCTTIPIASSDIIVVGGPLANLGAEYTNDFLEAFWGTPEVTPADEYKNKLTALTCWSLNSYVDLYDEEGNLVEGYALIGTHKDLNGTVWFVVWGITGQDTYYATWWLWRNLAGYALLENLPPGVTTIILKFDYTLHPTEECFWEIVEALGTISEVDLKEYFETDMPEGFWNHFTYDSETGLVKVWPFKCGVYLGEGDDEICCPGEFPICKVPPIHPDP